jgi:AcrR family transcriptional regulator
VEEICKKANVSKMTFYRHFNHKNELAEIVLKKILEEGFQNYSTIMDQEISFPEKIKNIKLIRS